MSPDRKFNTLKSMLVVICTALLSFSLKPGGDSFEIWLNGKQILQQYVHVAKGVQTLQLNSASENDKLDVYYSHCGRTGNGRYITIKDERDHPLKVWKFADVSGSHSAMSFKVGEILRLRKNKTEKLNLFYSSLELPGGRLLATITSEMSVLASR